MRDPVVLSALACLHREITREIHEVKAMIFELKEVMRAPLEFELESVTESESESESTSEESDSDDTLSVKSAPATVALERDGSLKDFWREHISDTYVNNDDN